MPETDRDSPLRFGVITDIHFGTGSESAAAAPETSAALRQWLELCRRNRVDFLFQLGDLIRGSEKHHREELTGALSILHEFAGPIRHVIGNHCLAIPRRELMAALGMMAPYYAWSEKGFRFVVLNGMDISTANEPRTPEEHRTLEHYLSQPGLHDYCGAVGREQIAWLQSELGRSELAGEPLIVVCHFPLLEETTDPKHGLLWNHREVAELLVSSPAVKVCLSGHYHYGGYAQRSGLHFVVLPAFVNRTEHPDFHFGTAELHRNRMVIRNQNDDIVHHISFR